MALGVVVSGQRPNADGTKSVFATLTGDTSYPAGGYALTPATFGLFGFKPINFGANVLFPIILGQQYSTAQVDADIDSTGHLRFFYPTGGGAAAPTTPAKPAIASGSTAMTSAAANGNTDLVPGIGQEVPSTTNVSTVSVMVEAVGH